MGASRPGQKTFSTALAVVGLLAALTAVPARAETWRGRDLERKLREAAWNFGPLRVQPSLVITNAGVDSNIYYAAADPVRDFTLTAGPAAALYLPVYRKLVFSLSGSPQYVWYSKTERERTWNYYLNGGASLNLKNLFLSLEGRYSDARERWNTEIDIRPRRKEEGWGATALVKAAWKTSVSLGFRAVRYAYESVEAGGGFNVQERLNRREQYANLSLFYQASSQRRFSVDLEYGIYDFEFAGQAAVSDSRSGAAYAGLEFSPLGRRVRGRIRVGYKKFDIRDPEGVDYQGFVGDSQLSVRLAKPVVIRGSYVRDVRFSLWYNNPFYLESRPGAGVSLYLLRFLRLDYDYSLGRNTYPVSQEVLPGEEVKRRDDYRIHSAAIYFRIRKSVGLGFVANFWTRDSNLDREDDKRTFFGVNLTYEF
jgi:hypothetical protein